MLGDDVAGVLSELRAHALSRMTSTAHVERVLAVSADPLTGADVETVETVHLSLPCRVKAAHGGLRPANVDGLTIAEQSDQLHFPWDAAGLDVGLRATITASRNPALVGRVYRLSRSPLGDDQTAQRWGVESWQ